MENVYSIKKRSNKPLEIDAQQRVSVQATVKHRQFILFKHGCYFCWAQLSFFVIGPFVQAWSQWILKKSGRTSAALWPRWNCSYERPDQQQSQWCSCCWKARRPSRHRKAPSLSRCTTCPLETWRLDGMSSTIGGPLHSKKPSSICYSARTSSINGSWWRLTKPLSSSWFICTRFLALLELIAGPWKIMEMWPSPNRGRRTLLGTSTMQEKSEISRIQFLT